MRQKVKCLPPIYLILCLVSACSHATPQATRNSAYPIAVDVKKVGTYPGFTKSGAGYFYDDVLEYRVWINPPEGGDDYYMAFPTYEEALDYSKKTLGAEKPLVLILQREWIDEPQPGRYIRKSEERLTEWQVEWLADSKRGPETIDRFLKEHERPDKRSQETPR